MILPIALAVSIHLSNLAHVPPATLVSAQAEVTRLYRAVGVSVDWIDDEAAVRPAPTVVRLVVIPHAGGELRDPRRGAMGATIRLSERTRVAYVFFTAVETQADRHAVSLVQVLACTMAHEIAHVLRPASGHAAWGLMRPNWNPEDFARANHGQLRFQ